MTDINGDTLTAGELVWVSDDDTNYYSAIFIRKIPEGYLIEGDTGRVVLMHYCVAM